MLVKDITRRLCGQMTTMARPLSEEGCYRLFGAGILYRRWCIIYTVRRGRDILYYLAEFNGIGFYPSLHQSIWRWSYTVECLCISHRRNISLR